MFLPLERVRVRVRFDGRKVLVTGGTGYVGGAVVRDLVEHGAEVTVLARRPHLARHLESRLGVRLVQGDVADASTLDLAGHDAVVHAAAWVAMGIPASKRERFWRTNVEGTRNVVEAARKAGVRKLVHVSSVAAIGTTGPAVADESFVPGPKVRSFYETTKREAHRIALAADDLDPVAVMPGVVVGKARPWADGARAAPASPMDFLLERFAEGRLRLGVRGDAPTPYVHVDDVADGVLRALERGRGPYLLTDGDLPLHDLLRRLGARIGRRPPRVRLPVPVLAAAFWGVERWYHLQGKVPPASPEIANGLRAEMHFDSGRARKELGWEPDLFARLARDYGT